MGMVKAIDVRGIGDPTSLRSKKDLKHAHGCVTRCMTDGKGR